MSVLLRGASTGQLARPPLGEMPVYRNVRPILLRVGINNILYSPNSSQQMPTNATVWLEKQTAKQADFLQATTGAVDSGVHNENENDTG